MLLGMEHTPFKARLPFRAALVGLAPKEVCQRILIAIGLLALVPWLCLLVTFL